MSCIKESQAQALLIALIHNKSLHGWLTKVCQILSLRGFFNSSSKCFQDGKPD